MALDQRGVFFRLLFCASISLAVSACSLFDVDSKGPQPASAQTPEKNKPQKKAPTTPAGLETLRSLSPPEGLRFAPLFDEKAENPDSRVKRLEDAVQDIRNDLDTVVPAIVRMAIIERDNRVLGVQGQALPANAPPVALAAAPPPAEKKTEVEQPTPLAGLPPAPAVSTVQKTGGDDIQWNAEQGRRAVETSAHDVPAAIPAPAAAVANPAAPAEKDEKPVIAAPALLSPAIAPSALALEEKARVAAPPTPPAAAEKQAPPPALRPAPLGDVKGIRIADHDDKTRVVLDMTAQYAGVPRIEKNGKQLVVPLDRLNWIGIKSFDVESAELVSGYHVAEGNLYLDLMYASQIKAQDVIPPNNESKDYRTVIDLFSPDVHKK